MATDPLRTAVLRLASRSSVVRPRDLVARNIPRHVLYALVSQGKLVQVGRGLYRLPEVDLTENHSFAEVSKRAPRGVICLLSALRFHGLTTELPSEVWYAIDRKGWAPTFTKPRLHLIRLSGDSFTQGIEVHDIEGVPVRIFSIAKTIADCFKFRNKIGTNIAVEALREAWTKRLITADDLWTCSKYSRVTNVMRPYLEALS